MSPAEEMREAAARVAEEVRDRAEVELAADRGPGPSGIATRIAAAIRTLPLPEAGPGERKGLDVEAIRARCEAATPGPWRYDKAAQSIDEGDGCYLFCAFGRDVDGDFAAHAREDIPALLAALGAAEARAETLPCGHHVSASDPEDDAGACQVCWLATAFGAQLKRADAAERERDHLKDRERSIVEACERVADGGQYRADIVSAIQRLRSERDVARAESAALRGQADAVSEAVRLFHEAEAGFARTQRKPVAEIGDNDVTLGDVAERRGELVGAAEALAALSRAPRAPEASPERDAAIATLIDGLWDLADKHAGNGSHDYNLSVSLRGLSDLARGLLAPERPRASMGKLEVPSPEPTPEEMTRLEAGRTTTLRAFLAATRSPEPEEDAAAFARRVAAKPIDPFSLIETVKLRDEQWRACVAKLAPTPPGLREQIEALRIDGPATSRGEGYNEAIAAVLAILPVS